MDQRYQTLSKTQYQKLKQKLSTNPVHKPYQR